MLPLFLAYTRWRYTRLARRVAREIAANRRAGIDVVGVVGIGGSPSCGVRRTLDLAGAVTALASCPWADLDRDLLNRKVIAANVVNGQGLFLRALSTQLEREQLTVPFLEHDLLSELGLPGPAEVSADRPTG